MTENIDSAEILLGYNKLIKLRAQQAIANKKYRATEHGKIKTIEIHRNWVSKKKDDVEYKKNTNLKQRERYQVRKLKKMEDAENLALEIVEIDISLADNI